ncbi:hypothetical protein PTKIN_Ptkin19aG0077100 [Pterospermum kingtungense]
MQEEEKRKRASDVSDAAGSSELEQKREVGKAELDDDFMSWLSMEGCETDDSMSELLKLLDDSAEAATSASSSTCSPTTSYGARVRFSDNPYSSALVFQLSSSYITINGNEESCGSSFSESESSVMASVDMGGVLSRNVGNGLEGIREWLLDMEGDAWGKSEEEGRECMMMDWEWGEEYLAWFLGEEEKYLF